MRNIMKIGIITLFILAANVFSQSKGGHWMFENNGEDTASWDNISDSGSLYTPAYFTNTDPVPDDDYYLGLDSLNAYDFFRVEDSDDLDFDNENIGISAWIKPIVLNNVHFLVSKGVQDANPKTTNYAIRISRTNELEFLIRDASNKARVAASGIIITEGKWTFVAAFYDYGAKKVYFWNEPVEQAFSSVDFNQDFFSNSDPLGIGAWSTTDSLAPTNSNFEGDIDDVRISGRMEDILPVLSPVRSVHASVANQVETLEIYPNPVSISGSGGQIRFNLKSASAQIYNYTIYNVLGQIVYRGGSINKSKNLNIQWNIHDNSGYQIHTGIYFIEFKGAQNRIVNKFLVIK